MLLMIDSNEQATNSRVVERLKKNFSQVIVTSLKVGDINIPLDDGTLLAIERKTPSDFLGSVADGRIFRQVEEMQREAKYCAIIITGSFAYTDKTDVVKLIDDDTQETTTRDKWRGSAIRAAMIVIQYSSCPIIFCPPSKLSMSIVELFNAVNQPDERRSVRKNRIITFPPIDERVNTFAQFPGVGLKSSESMLRFAGMMEQTKDEEGYGSLADALHYMTILNTIDKASRPVGWGPAKVLSLRKFLSLESDEYLAKVKEIEIKQGKKTIPAVEINGAIYTKQKEV